MTPSLCIRALGLLPITSGLALGYPYISHPQQMRLQVIASPNWKLIHGLFAVWLVLGLAGTAWRQCRISSGYLGFFLILAAIAFGAGLSPPGDIGVARITAAVFGAALVAVGVSAMLQNRNRNAAARENR